MRRSPTPTAARALFTELEFTTLVQEFLSESIELGETDYREAQSAADVERLVSAVRSQRGAALVLAIQSSSAAAIIPEEEEEAEAEDEQLSFGAAAGCRRSDACQFAGGDFRRTRQGADSGARRLQAGRSAEEGAGGRVAAQDHPRRQIGDACLA